MKGLFKVLFAFIVFSAILPMGAALAQGKRDPDAAYDPVNNRYLMVWEESDGANTNILAQFRNPDGSVGAGAPTLISVPRPTQGCFYGQFDSQNGDITTPTDCPGNKNPSVAFNNGQYIVVWEVHGTAGAPSSAPDNQFINLFAKVIDANTLNPLSGWEEGILISKVFIAANNAESRCGDRHACNDSQIQAWSKSINPDVAPRVGGQGFVVTWQTNKDFIGCADADRRRGWAVYGRYIDQNFSATSTTNPPAFAVFKDDSTMAESCEPTSNVDNGSNPRIAVNQTSNDFVIAYEIARASGGNASIGAKRVTLDAGNVGQVNGSIMPDIVANVSGSSLNSPEIISFRNQYVLFASDGSNIRGKSFASDSITASEPAVIPLGSGSKINPRAANNLGIGGQRPAPNAFPERMLIAYENGGNIFVATLNDALAVARGPENISSGMGTANRAVEITSDSRNFLGVWGGQDGGDQVFAELISSLDGGVPTPTPNVAPTAPGLLTPNDMVTFAPIRAYLSWNASTDSDGGTVTYRIYFGENVIPAMPQVIGVTATDFVIGPETFAMSGITLLPNKIYKWKVEADDGQGGLTSSPVRTLNTDNSVVAWWRFDENPAGPVCAGGVAGESVCDSSGNVNHAIPNGGIAWLPPPMVGLLGGGLNLDGINDYLSIQDSVSINPDSLTVFTKIQTNGKVGAQHILDKRQGGRAGYNLRLEGAAFPLNLLWIITDSSGSEHLAFNAGVINDLTNYHLATTFNLATGGVNSYVDGGVISTQNFGVINRVMKSSISLIIGDRSDVVNPTTSSYKGILDEIILLNKSASTQEVENNFNAAN